MCILFSAKICGTACLLYTSGKAIQFIDDMDKKEYGVLNPLSDAY